VNLAATSLDEALELRAEHPAALPVAGGTDVLVALNAGARHEGYLDLTRVPELAEWRRADDVVVLGAGVTYTRIITELAGQLPGLAHASRTVGSAQIRNRGTLGGNLATASPAGDGLPPLVAAGAQVELASRAGRRTLPVAEFLTGPKRSALGPDELVVAVRIPAAGGPQVFSKIGSRNAMVIAVASLALDVDAARRRVGVALGSVGPTTIDATAAAAFLAGIDVWDRDPTPAEAAEFARLAADAARPISDHRGSAAYRRHAIGVMAARALQWAREELREAA
jgi:CO/xanthine dehydrogenase FAD-binding subunit